jgi:two-component system, NtrC family, sensor histidine kinase PilS
MTGPDGEERRRADRRRGERRRLPRFSASEPWRNSGGVDAGSGWAADAAATPESRFGAADSRNLEAGRPVAGEGAALPRILRTYMVVRGALGIVLVLAPWVAVLLGGRLPLPMMLVCLAYAGQAISLWLLPGLAGDADRPTHDRLSRTQWVMTIGVDVAAFSLLRLLDETSQLNYAALLVLPVLMAGVLTRRLAALATAAVVTLVLLAGVISSAVVGGDVMLQLSQAGLAGAGLFVIALLASEIAQRLAREEQAARGNMELARQQTQLNRVVIEEMTEGVLVVDRRGDVRALNPAARSLLGMQGAAPAPPFTLAIDAAWAPLQSAIERAFLQGLWPDDSRELDLTLPDGAQHRVQVRARFTRRSGIGAGRRSAEDFCVLFLEDLRVAQARTRQEKLAAMGRMSAGIAHEIRNPLAAIAQANALLLEDGLASGNERLARIVEDNVGRLKRIVDDVMAVAPGAAPRDSAIDARAELLKICEEWLRAVDASGQPTRDGGDRLRLELPSAPLPTLFDPDHLRRVLINLLDNAARHASAAAGAIVLRLQPLQRIDAVEISVASDGAPIPPEVERHLFEPFFSTRSRGSGLGLYICRELCERHRASIEFRPGAPTDRHRNCFRILMRRAPQS